MLVVAAVLAGSGLSRKAEAFQVRADFPAKLVPVDEAHRDAAFVLLRERLLKAARGGDIDTVLAAASRDITVRLESPLNGPGELRRLWDIEGSPMPFLDALVEVLGLGGVMTDDGRAFVAPYVWAAFPSVDLSTLPDYAVVIRPNAPLRVAPAQEAPIAARLENDIVTFYEEKKGWVHVTLRDGRNGFMSDKDVRSVIAPRAVFRKVGGVWMLTEFVQGWH